ncbi:MAG: DUF488 domain-containing protein [Candidatus Binatia bacterium]
MPARRAASATAGCVGSAAAAREWRARRTPAGASRGSAPTPDYRHTAPFAVALAELEAMAGAAPSAFMCAEALWWQCHRRLIADALPVRGWAVRHLVGGRLAAHALPEFARVDGERIVYDCGVTPPLL